MIVNRGVFATESWKSVEISLLIRAFGAIFWVVMVTACSGSENRTEVPEYILEMENVTIYDATDIEAADTLQLVQEQVFGDTDEVYIGRVREFVTDESGRVYVIDSAMDARAIHAYEPDGSYITTIGRMGRGPGEYLNPCCMEVRSNRLTVYDHGLSRLTVYSTDTWNILETVNLNLSLMEGAEQLKDKRFNKYFYLDHETLLLRFIKPQHNDETDPGSIHYYTGDTAFHQIEDEVYVQDHLLEVWGDWGGNRVMKYYPFYSKPLIAVTPSGRVFIANSDELLVRELNREGDEIAGFYIPAKKVLLTRDDAFGNTNEMERDIARNAVLPNYWPVMKSMWSDDRGRLWISTVTENEDEINWWVVDPDGGVKAKFRWAGNRNAYPLINGRTYKHIRGDYFYTREDDEKTGLQTVVRYRIEMDD